MARPAVRAADVVEKPGIYRGRDSRPGARDRVEHGHFQRRPCHVPGAAPLSRRGPARHGLVEQSGRPKRHSRSRLLRVAPSFQRVLRLACHRHADGQSGGRRPAGTDESAGRDARPAGDDVPRPPARDGAAVSRRGRHAGQGPGGHPEPQPLAGALRRRSERARPGDPDRRQVIHRRRRARQGALRSLAVAALDPARLLAGPDQSRLPQCAGDGAAEAGRLARSGECGHEDRRRRSSPGNFPSPTPAGARASSRYATTS